MIRDINHTSDTYDKALSRRKNREAQFLRKWYPKILKTFNFDPEEDKRAARLLSNQLNDVKSPGLSILFNSLHKKPAIVAGAGPSLEEGLKRFFHTHNIQSMVKIASDGAAKGLLDLGFIPDIVITDGDGLRLEELNILIERNSIIIVHAHGDNIPFLMNLTRDILKQTIGSTQTPSLPHVYNWGGFTDGDRAALLAEIMGSHEIYLIGMDFGSIIGRYSKPPYLKEEIATKTKRLKLQFAQEIISEMIASTKIPVYPISSIP